MNIRILIAVGVLWLSTAHAQQIVSTKTTPFAITQSVIYVDANETELVQTSAQLLQKDIELVTGRQLPIVHTLAKVKQNVIAIGTPGQSAWIKQLVAGKKLNPSKLPGAWETYHLQTLQKPTPAIAQALVISGSDRRGVAYGVFELSRQLGVSPWHWWADVPVKKQSEIYLFKNVAFSDAPRVKYRGIFLNDEAPALSGWTKEKFGGFNHKFYEKVFELILRLKGNYLWPAMWGNAFYADDSLNIQMAEKYGIVIGTSHHEPLMRAHDEWRRFGKGPWNYEQNKQELSRFWREGMQRATNEKIVSVGMRGDGDEPMSRETATALLEQIVKDQREIISEVTGKGAEQTPQLWALYKEVQDYYDKGMRVPDDVTLLLCDDNWGNLRKLPAPTAKARKGGYGIYYHFDYVGGPRNYKWLNTNPLPRIWEQMHLAWQHDVKNIWIVNVGDLKPMEFPISFFLDYAWNPDRIGADQLQSYTETWAAAQFGETYARDIAFLVARYAKYNARRKPELLDAKTYSLETGEWAKVVADYNQLLAKAEALNQQIPTEYRDAFFQLVLHPIQACANLNAMYYHVALNTEAYQQKWKQTNAYADKVQELYANDSLITQRYHQLNNGKWNHLMSQTHIGYTSWQQPNVQRMPKVMRLAANEGTEKPVPQTQTNQQAKEQAKTSGHAFYQDEKRGVSIEADHFSRVIHSNVVTWKVLPDHGRTGSALTAFPVTAPEQKPEGNAPHVEYDVDTYSAGEATIHAYFSPSLNFYSSEKGLQYAISVDDAPAQIFSINQEDKTSDRGIWNKWAGSNIIIKTSRHVFDKPGQHTLKFWLVSPGVVLQKLVVDFGGVEQSYLGPEETLYQTKTN
ncbi:glycosyl hydrolase 115 family protein [Siphonobacter curvatus]|uniref:Glycosyhydrolase n=1 Tax=Siphonobacter curvatus TaxID=2094562 RepID=A0A2S7IHK6_9BACT|nr:glycosyl hydrolase 115 family protein [Siphonobacter curvatus]PQA55117.1 glycosyhydrolase [Siphonobacter curvatus]